MKQYIPNGVTLLNMFLGCLAVVMAFQGMIHLSGIFIALAAVLDFLDGFLARILKAGSALGQQLDSMADLISFGMAPGAILFFYMSNTTQVAQATSFFVLLPYLAFLITVFSGLRLAIFNLDTRQTSSFIGLPTPANALFFASFPVALYYGSPSGVIYWALEMITTNLWLLLALTLIFCWLLVSPLRMFSLKFASLEWSENSTRYTLILGALLLFLIFQLKSVPLVVIFYIILSILGQFFPKRRKIK